MLSISSSVSVPFNFLQKNVKECKSAKRTDKVNSKINRKKVSKKHKYAYADISNQVQDHYYSQDIENEYSSELNIYYNECHVMCQKCRDRSIQYQEPEMAYVTICNSCSHCQSYVNCDNKICKCNDKCDNCGGYDIDECENCIIPCYTPIHSSFYSPIIQDTSHRAIEYVLLFCDIPPNIRLGLEKALELI